MARQMRKWNPGDAANAFVRVILSDAGQLLGGISNDEWAATWAYFDGNCAYTGQPLDPQEVERDHAIPMNREHCGLHIWGNVVPTSKAVNREKRDTHYRDFVKDESLRERIDQLMEHAAYEERVASLGDLRNYCRAQYDAVDQLCRVNRRYLASLLPAPAHEADVGSVTPAGGLSWARASSQAREGSLPIAFDPAPEEAFKEALLRARRAFITTYYADGRSETKTWNARRFAASSHVSGNLRTRPQFRSGTWQKLGIQRIEVSIRDPRRLA